MSLVTIISLVTFSFDSPEACAHRPAGRFFGAPSSSPQPWAPAHHTTRTVRYCQTAAEGGRAEARKRRGGRYF